MVFVTPTALQLTIFAKILNADKLDNLMQSSTAESLALINMLTKISNSPILLKATADKAKKLGDEADSTIKRAGVEDALKLLPERVQVEDMSLSGAQPPNLEIFSPKMIQFSLHAGKLTAISNLLRILREVSDRKLANSMLFIPWSHTAHGREMYSRLSLHLYVKYPRSFLQEKIIFLLSAGWVSTTSGDCLQPNNIPCSQTPAAKRQEYINVFNKSSQRSGCR